MAVAALVTFAATFLTLRLSRKHSIMPEIRERDVHTDPTPRIGGLAMLIVQRAGSQIKVARIT
jgi:UDP-GlcNAc:undecaprenyl-phosphate GlcNAc-1-phosphate transferase